MLRELRRFRAVDFQGRGFTVCEVQSVHVVNGVEHLDGGPTLFTAAGFEVLPTGVPGEYRISRVGITLREAKGATA